MKPISRMEIAVLALLLTGSVGASLLLQQTGAVGQDVGDLQTAQAVRQDRTSPASENRMADVTLVVFSDYQCPACLLAYPDMKRAVAKDGKVRVVFKDWPIFGERSKLTAEVALASRYQNIYVQVHDLLMSGKRLDGQTLKSAVEQSGGSWAQLQTDLGQHRRAIEEQLARNAQQAFSLGLGGTPAYLIGPILIRGRVTEADFSRVIAQVRAKDQRL